MTDVKSWIKSKTLWGILIALSPMISKFIGYDFGVGLNEAVELVGMAFAAYGRFVATKTIK